jgi:hypothetical protein
MYKQYVLHVYTQLKILVALRQADQGLLLLLPLGGCCFLRLSVVSHNVCCVADS